LTFTYKDLVVAYKVVVHRHSLAVVVHRHSLVVVVHHHNLAVVDKNCLDHIVDNLVDSEVDKKVEHLQDNIAVVAEEVDHNLVAHKHLLLVYNRLVADNN